MLHFIINRHRHIHHCQIKLQPRVESRSIYRMPRRIICSCTELQFWSPQSCNMIINTSLPYDCGRKPLAHTQEACLHQSYGQHAKESILKHQPPQAPCCRVLPSEILAAAPWPQLEELLALCRLPIMQRESCTQPSHIFSARVRPAMTVSSKCPCWRKLYLT